MWNNILHVTIPAVLRATENLGREIRLFWQNLAHSLQYDETLLRQATVWSISELQHKGPGSFPPETENLIPLSSLLLATIEFMPIWYGLRMQGYTVLSFLAIFFTTACCKVKLCCDNFHTTFTAASSVFYGSISTIEVWFIVRFTASIAEVSFR